MVKIVFSTNQRFMIKTRDANAQGRSSKQCFDSAARINNTFERGLSKEK